MKLEKEKTIISIFSHDYNGQKTNNNTTIKHNKSFKISSLTALKYYDNYQTYLHQNQNLEKDQPRC